MRTHPAIRYNTFIVKYGLPVKIPDNNGWPIFGIYNFSVYYKWNGIYTYIYIYKKGYVIVFVVLVRFIAKKQKNSTV